MICAFLLFQLILFNSYSKINSAKRIEKLFFHRSLVIVKPIILLVASLTLGYNDLVQASTHVIELPQLLSKRSLNKPVKGQALKIAEVVPVNFDTRKSSNQKHWVKDNSKAKLSIEINGQQPFMNLGFTDVFIPPKGELLVLDKNTRKVLFRYTEQDNKTHRQIWTPSIYGQNVVVEFRVPEEYQDNASLTLKQVSQGVDDGFNKSLSKRSGDCNIDVVCGEGDFFNNEIRSVARYTISDGVFTYNCTGQLVNNTEQDLKAYFLTARHCNVSEANAPSMVFYWNFQRAVCGQGSGSTQQTQNGATYRSSWGTLGQSGSGSDMALVELDALPNSIFNVYYSGWDRRNVEPSSAIAVHQPSGDEKAISFDNDALTVTDYLVDTRDAQLQQYFLRIGDWEEGTTEPGSSGSGIWNSQRHLVGTLSGGRAACETPTSPTDNDQPDWYGRFYSHWEGGGTAETQLKAWLDPQNRGVETLNGKNLCTGAQVNIIASTQNPAIGASVDFSAEVEEGFTITSYAWDFDHDNMIDSTAATQSFTYNQAFTGNVTLTVTDNTGCQSFATRAIVADNNQAPVAPTLANSIADQSFDQGDQVNLDVSAAFNDNNLSYELINAPASLSIDNTGTISGTLNGFDARFSPYAASLIVSNGERSDKLEFTINVASANNAAPILDAQLNNLSLEVGESVSLDVSGNFSDANEDLLLFSMDGAPEGLSISSAGLITGTVAAGAESSSPYTVRVSASDGTDNVTATFSITVTNTSGGPGPGNGSSDDGGSGSYFWIALLGLLHRRAKPTSKPKAL